MVTLGYVGTKDPVWILDFSENISDIFFKTVKCASYMVIGDRNVIETNLFSDNSDIHLLDHLLHWT